MPAASASPGPPALAASGVVKSFGHVRALRGIDFALADGEALAIFGPNGAGKTTLLRVLAGLLRPDAGRVVLAGREIGRAGAEHRRRIGYISHQSLLYDGLTARENLRFYARLYGLADREATVEAALAGVGLEGRTADAVRTFSRGMVQRLAIARALLHRPQVVLLDEPFTGLDQAAAASLREVLGALRGAGKTMVLVTHNLDEGLELATHVAIQVAGRLVDLAPREGADPGLYRGRYAALTAPHA